MNSCIITALTLSTCTPYRASFALSGLFGLAKGLRGSACNLDAISTSRAQIQTSHFINPSYCNHQLAVRFKVPVAFSPSNGAGSSFYPFDVRCDFKHRIFHRVCILPHRFLHSAHGCSVSLLFHSVAYRTRISVRRQVGLGSLKTKLGRVVACRRLGHADLRLDLTHTPVLM